MFYRRDRPGPSPYTLLLLILWLILAVYLITHPDPISIIVLVVTLIIAVAAIVLSIMVRRAQADGTMGHGGGAASQPADDQSAGASNGRYHAGANGRPSTQRHETDTLGEIPDEGGTTP